MHPEISIITINYNNLQGLKQTMRSVFDQVKKNFEYIVIDGGSTDGSAAYIESHAGQVDHWVSEKDGGIYNAMNKGIAKATGKYLLFLNSGDYLYNDLALQPFEGLKEDILCADIKIIEATHDWIKKAPAAITFRYFLKETLPHQSALIKKELLVKAGMYNEQLKIVSDWKFYLDALCKYGASYRHVPTVVAVYVNNGYSSRPENLPLLEQERVDTLKKDFTFFYDDYLQLLQYESKLRSFENSRIQKAICFVKRLFNKNAALNNE